MWLGVNNTHKITGEGTGGDTKLMQFSLGVTKIDRFRNEIISGTACIGCFRRQRWGRLIEMVWEKG